MFMKVVLPKEKVKQYLSWDPIYPMLDMEAVNGL